MRERLPGLLFIVNSLDVGGAEKQLVTFINHLDESRFRLHLAYIKRGERLLPQLHTGKLDELICCDVKRGIELEGIRRLRRLIVADQIDAIVCTNKYSMLYGTLARGGRKRPRLATVFHSTLLSTYREKAQMLLYQRLFKRCDLLIYVCENQRQYWHERGLRVAADTVIYNGIDVDHFVDLHTSGQRQNLRQSLGFDSQDYVVGLCSALRPEKAHGDLLDALALLRSRGAPAKGLLIGDGPERPALERKARELHLAEHVHITGIQHDVRPFVGCCDVMTLVSHSETFSLAALESMALGKPLVLSDVGGASEQVIHGQNGFLFDPGDVDELATHLSSLTSGALRTQMGAAASRRVRQLFTVEAMTAAFTERLGTLAAESAGRLSVES